MIDNAAYGKILADGTLRFERLLPGPIERVWDYLTKPESLAKWIAPFNIPRTPGASFTHTWEGGGTLTGRIRIYQPPAILEYEWNESDAPGGAIHETIARFELTVAGKDVRLVLTHRLLPARTRVMIAAGWHSHLDALIADVNGTERVDPDERYDVVVAAYRGLAHTG